VLKQQINDSKAIKSISTPIGFNKQRSLKKHTNLTFHMRTEIKKSYFLFFLVAILLQSCDPIRTLVIKVPKGINASVIVYANENMLRPSLAQQDSTTKKVIIKIPTNDTTPQREKRLYYELGVGIIAT